jgi:hypothetical protein
MNSHDDKNNQLRRQQEDFDFEKSCLLNEDELCLCVILSLLQYFFHDHSWAFCSVTDKRIGGKDGQQI